MKKRFHSFAAGLGVVCAVAFTMVPFLAGAEIGPGHAPVAVKPAPVTSPPPTVAPKPPKMRINRPDVRNDDGGCG